MKALKVIMCIILIAALCIGIGLGVYTFPYKVDINTDNAVMYNIATKECISVNFNMQGHYARRLKKAPAFSGSFSVAGGGWDVSFDNITISYPADDPLFMGFIFNLSDDKATSVGNQILTANRADTFCITFYDGIYKDRQDIAAWRLCVGAANQTEAEQLIAQCNIMRKDR